MAMNLYLGYNPAIKADKPYILIEWRTGQILSHHAKPEGVISCAKSAQLKLTVLSTVFNH